MKKANSIRPGRAQGLGGHLFFLLLCGLAGLSLAGQSLDSLAVDSLRQRAQRHPDDSTRARAYNRLAFHFLFQDLAEAKKILDQALPLTQKPALAFARAELLNTRATYFDLLGSFDSAAHYFERSLAISRAQDFPNIEVMTLNSLGLLYWKAGQFDKAQAFFYQALEINLRFFAYDEESRANYYSNIGLIYQELKQQEKALRYHDSALALRQRGADRNGQAISYANMAICKLDLADYPAAERFFQKALQNSQAAGNDWLHYALYNDLGRLYQLQGRFREAVDAYQRSLDAPEGVKNNPKRQLSSFQNLAQLYNELEKPQTALAFAQQGLALLEAYPQLYAFAADLHYAHAEANFRLGRMAEGGASMQQYRAVKDSLFSEKNARAIAEMEEKYQSSQKDKALLEQAHTIQLKELDIRRRSLWLITFGALFLLVAGALFYRLKRKEQLAAQAALQLDLAAEQERSRLQEERLRISRELHDNVGAHLSLIQASLEHWPDSQRPSPDRLAELQGSLKMGMLELRKTVWLLHNEALSLEALCVRLRDFFKPLQQSERRIQVQCMAAEGQALSAVQATQVFRILQEAVSNAIKHSQASEIVVQLYQEEGKTHFSVRDNGGGFAPAFAEKGQGLANMQARIRELGGHLRIASAVGEPTLIEGSF